MAKKEIAFFTAKFECGKCDHVVSVEVKETDRISLPAGWTTLVLAATPIHSRVLCGDCTTRLTGWLDDRKVAL